MTISKTFKFEITLTVDDEDADIFEKAEEVYNRGRLNDRILNMWHFGYKGFKGRPHQHIAKKMGLDLTEGKTIDHIDNNTGNNTRENLRAATKKEQAANRRKQQGSISVYRGAYIRREQNKNRKGVIKTYEYWYAGVQGNGRSIRRACKSELAAAKLYDKLVKEMGLDKPLNFPEETT